MELKRLNYVILGLVAGTWCAAENGYKVYDGADRDEWKFSTLYLTAEPTLPLSFLNYKTWLMLGWKTKNGDYWMSELMHNAMLFGQIIFLKSDLSMVLMCIHEMCCIRHLSNILFIYIYFFNFHLRIFSLLFMKEREREKRQVREKHPSVSWVMLSQPGPESLHGELSFESCLIQVRPLCE